MTPSDKLDELTDFELSEVFAKEVAGWRNDPDEGWYDENGLSRPWPDFAASADAVLPFLEKLPSGCEIGWWPSVAWSVQFYVPSRHPGNCFKSECEAAGTLPRAACIALIAAKRAEKEDV